MFSLPNSGWIRKDKNLPSQQDMHYEMRSMNENDLEDIIELQSVVIQNMNDREIYRTHSIDYFIEHIQMGSYAIGTFTDDGLIAYSILYFIRIPRCSAAGIKCMRVRLRNGSNQISTVFMRRRPAYPAALLRGCAAAV